MQGFISSNPNSEFCSCTKTAAFATKSFSFADTRRLKLCVLQRLVGGKSATHLASYPCAVVLSFVVVVVDTSCSTFAWNRGSTLVEILFLHKEAALLYRMEMPFEEMNQIAKTFQVSISPYWILLVVHAIYHASVQPIQTSSPSIDYHH